MQLAILHCKEQMKRERQYNQLSFKKKAFQANSLAFFVDIIRGETHTVVVFVVKSNLQIYIGFFFTILTNWTYTTLHFYIQKDFLAIITYFSEESL